VMRAPPQLRFVLAARHDVRLGLHRLRLEGGLSEIRAADLRFSLAEAKELLEAAGVGLSAPVLMKLHERTEGWAAGLRLAALALAGHPDPERFAEEFSGSERTVAEYLLAEVLDRQNEQVQRLLLRTSILDSVNGELADLLTGARVGPGSATTACSPICCSWNCAAPNPTRSRGCTAKPQIGSPGTDTRCRPSNTPRRPGTGSWPHACSPTTGPPLILTGRLPPSMSFSPGSLRRPGWRTRSSPC